MTIRELKTLDEISEKLDPKLRNSLAQIIVKQDRLLWILKSHLHIGQDEYLNEWIFMEKIYSANKYDFEPIRKWLEVEE